MIAPTHLAFNFAVAKLAGAGELPMALFLIGGVLPDVDHPQSFVGKILYPISQPLNAAFGHRQLVHSLTVWGPLLALGLLWSPAAWFAAGGIAHAMLDCANKTGVQLLAPFADFEFVFPSNKNLRILTAGRAELSILCLLVVLGYGFTKIEAFGGFRYFVSYLVGSFEVSLERYMAAGEKVCHFSGYLRYPNGTVLRDRWLVVGKEGNDGCAIWDHRQERVLHVPAEAVFLSCWIEASDREWNHTRVADPMTVKFRNGRGFMLAEKPAATGGDILPPDKTAGNAMKNYKEWISVASGDTVKGYVNYESGIIELFPPVERDLFK